MERIQKLACSSCWLLQGSCLSKGLLSWRGNEPNSCHASACKATDFLGQMLLMPLGPSLSTWQPEPLESWLKAVWASFGIAPAPDASIEDFGSRLAWPSICTGSWPLHWRRSLCAALGLLTGLLLGQGLKHLLLQDLELTLRVFLGQALLSGNERQLVNCGGKHG